MIPKLEGMVLPDYNGNSVANIVPTIMEHFGIKPAAPVNPKLKESLHGIERVVMLLIDGLGYGQLKREQGLVLNQLPGDTITSCAPSTTVTVLSSVATGLLPSQHGVIGYTMNIPGMGVVNVLRHKADGVPVDIPHSFFPHEPVIKRLAKAGLNPAAVMPNYIRHSGMSKWTLHDEAFHGYARIDDCFATISRLLPSSNYVFAYAELYDTLCHHFGHEADAPRFYLKGLDSALRHFLDDSWRNTLLIVTADHGQITTRRNHSFLYTDHPALMGMVDAISGEGRFGCIHAKQGMKDAVKDYLYQHIAPIAAILSKDEALPLFGPPNHSLNIGDFVVIGREDYQIWDRPSYHVGKHGGLSEAEMRVPLIVERL